MAEQIRFRILLLIPAPFCVSAFPNIIGDYVSLGVVKSHLSPFIVPYRAISDKIQILSVIHKEI